MCEEPYHDPDLETDTDDTDLDILEYYDYREEPPRKPKYFPASPPLPLADRLAYYKYAREFQKFVNDLHKLFTPLPFPPDPAKTPKKKLLCVRMGTEHFVLEPKHAEQKMPFTEMSYFGITQRYPTAPPNITMLTHLISNNEKVMIRKYEYIRDQFQQANPLSVNICGHLWYATDIDCNFLPELSVAITFTMYSDVKQGRHQWVRAAEARHKKRFAKFAALT